MNNELYVIEKIYWERATLHILLNNKINDSSVFLVAENNKLLLNTIDNEIIVNITNIPQGKSLEYGIYKILINNKHLIINKELLKKFDNLSRVFKYKNNKCACVVNFETNNEEEFIINVDYMIHNNKYHKYLTLSEGKNIKEKSIILFKLFAIFLVNFLYYIFRFFKFKNKNYLFLCDNSDELIGNLQDAYDLIKNRKKYVFTINASEHNYYKYIIKELWLLSRADYIIIDNYVSLLTLLKISKKTNIIQLWHAGIGFKSVGYARFGKNGSAHPFISCHRKYDLALVDSSDFVDIYQEVFGIDKEKIKVYPMPRLNNYLNQQNIDSKANDLFEKYKLLKNKKLILFSPTYRGIGIKDAYYDYSVLNFDKIYEFCKNNNFIFIFKMHNYIKKTPYIDKKYQDFIIDLSNENINDLIYISDIMITDYSSCCYEYSFFNRPLIFFRYDKDKYEYERSFHSSDKYYKDAIEVFTFDELMNILNKYNNIDINKRFNNIKSIKNSESNLDVYIESVLK